MSTLLEIREKIKLLYSRSEFVLVPVWKFMMAYLALCMVNGKLGYMPAVDNLGLVLVVALMCSFLPNGFILFFAGAFSLFHIYKLSMEVALVALILYLVIFFMFGKFTGEHSGVMLLTYVLMGMKLPYIAPIVVGLVSTPLACVSIACGIVAYCFIDNIAVNASLIGGMGSEEAFSKIKIAIDGLVQNKAMLVMIVAFSIAVFVVYFLRRLSIEYSWTIGMVSGAIVELVVLLAGDLSYDTHMSLGMAILGAVLALVAGKILEFFKFCVDYSRTEKVQFEDDEYYYYVKAVPKMNVALSSKTVKHINSQRNPETVKEHVRKEASAPKRKLEVETERTGVSRNNGFQEKVTGKSVTISNEFDDDDDLEFFDEI